MSKNIIEELRAAIAHKAVVLTNTDKMQGYIEGALSLLPLVEKLIEQRNDYVAGYYANNPELLHAGLYGALNETLLDLLKDQK